MNESGKALLCGGGDDDDDDDDNRNNENIRQNIRIRRSVLQTCVGLYNRK